MPPSGDPQPPLAAVAAQHEEAMELSHPTLGQTRRTKKTQKLRVGGTNSPPPPSQPPSPANWQMEGALLRSPIPGVSFRLLADASWQILLDSAMIRRTLESRSIQEGCGILIWSLLSSPPQGEWLESRNLDLPAIQDLYQRASALSRSHTDNLLFSHWGGPSSPLLRVVLSLMTGNQDPHSSLANRISPRDLVSLVEDRILISGFRGKDNTITLHSWPEMSQPTLPIQALYHLVPTKDLDFIHLVDSDSAHQTGCPWSDLYPSLRAALEVWPLDRLPTPRFTLALEGVSRAMLEVPCGRLATREPHLRASPTGNSHHTQPRPSQHALALLRKFGSAFGSDPTGDGPTPPKGLNHNPKPSVGGPLEDPPSPPGKETLLAENIYHAAG